MHILIIGAGAIGSFLAAQLAQHVRITLIDRHATELTTQVIEVVGALTKSGRVDIAPSILNSAAEGPDLIMVTTRTTQLEAVLEVVKHCTAPLVFWQNGVGVNQFVRERLSEIPVMRALIWTGVNRLEQRVIQCNGFARVLLGVFQGQADPAPLARTLTESGLKTEIVADVDRAEWEKSLWNIGVGSLCAVTKERNGVVIESPLLRTLLIELVREAQLVAAAMGHPNFDEVDSIIRLTKKTAANVNSMLIDVQRIRETEIEYLNGYVVRMGEQHGIPTPCNRVLYTLVKHLERRNSADGLPS
jgi:2-dehydropantoate 2-reductase